MYYFLYVVSIFLGKSPITVIPADPPFTAAVVNTLGEGERVTSIVVTDSIQPKFDGKLFITGFKL